MNHIKIISIMLVVSMLAFFPVSVAQAATGTSVPGTGTILSTTIVTDPGTGISTVVVTLLDDAGLAQKVSMSLENAIEMGLVIPTAADALTQPVSIPNTDPLDPAFVLTGTVSGLAFVTDPVTGITSLNVTLTDDLLVVHVVNLDLESGLTLGLVSTDTTKVGTPIVIDPLVILESTIYTKIVTDLGTYFGAALGLTYDQLAAYKAEGFGYGLIAQASWMALQMDGDAALLAQILAAKKAGTLSTIILPDGTTAANWGQFRKAVLTDPHQNLGSVVSGKAEPIPTTTTTTTTLTATTTTANQGNGNGNSNGNGNADGNNGNGKSNSNGNNGKGGDK